MGCSLDVVPTLWASYAIFGQLGLSDGVHLKNDIDKVVTVFVNGKSITVHALYGARLDCMRVLWA